MGLILSGIAAFALVVALFLIPLGLPGLWVMVGVLLLGLIFGEVGWLVLLTTVVVAGLAELIEFVLVKRLTGRYGGSRGAFWGAIAGGLVGVVVGMPVPIIGPILAGIVGTFAGAMAVTLMETRELGGAARVGWGATLGRVAAAAAKTAAGLVIVVLGISALLFA